MNRYLIGFGSDVTKLRAQLLQNFDLIPTEEGQEDIKNRIEALPERFYDALIPIMII